MILGLHTGYLVIARLRSDIQHDCMSSARYRSPNVTEYHYRSAAKRKVNISSEPSSASRELGCGDGDPKHICGWHWNTMRWKMGWFENSAPPLCVWAPKQSARKSNRMKPQPASHVLGRPTITAMATGQWNEGLRAQILQVSLRGQIAKDGCLVDSICPSPLCSMTTGSRHTGVMHRSFTGQHTRKDISTSSKDADALSAVSSHSVAPHLDPSPCERARRADPSPCEAASICL
jgi:hypothetical protein